GDRERTDIHELADVPRNRCGKWDVQRHGVEPVELLLVVRVTCAGDERPLLVEVELALSEERPGLQALLIVKGLCVHTVLSRPENEMSQFRGEEQRRRGTRVDVLLQEVGAAR